MTDYEKMDQIIKEIDELLGANVSSSDASFQAWKTKAERFLIRKFGQDSLEYKKFDDTAFSLRLFQINTPENEFVEACQKDLLKTKAIFQTYLEEMMEEEDNNTKVLATSARDYSRMFIVHGHDGELKQAVARIIEKQEIEAVVLSEKANIGRTIIEKFEDYADVDGAICLFTADDLGKERNGSLENARARQNVIFETGFFMGKLGRDRVMILVDKDVEIPSDLSGVVYTSSSNWELELLKEVKAMGYSIDFNKLFNN